MAHKEYCTQEEFEELHRRVDKVRRNTPDVKVPAQALRNLLEDYSALLREIDKTK